MLLLQDEIQYATPVIMKKTVEIILIFLRTCQSPCHSKAVVHSIWSISGISSSSLSDLPGLSWYRFQAEPCSRPTDARAHIPPYTHPDTFSYNSVTLGLALWAPSWPVEHEEGFGWQELWTVCVSVHVCVRARQGLHSAVGYLSILQNKPAGCMR